MSKTYPSLSMYVHRHSGLRTSLAATMGENMHHYILRTCMSVTIHVLVYKGLRTRVPQTIIHPPCVSVQGENFVNQKYLLFPTRYIPHFLIHFYDI